MTPVLSPNFDPINFEFTGGSKELFLWHGAEVNHRDDSGRSAMDYAQLRQPPALAALEVMQRGGWLAGWLAGWVGQWVGGRVGNPKFGISRWMVLVLGFVGVAKH